MASYGYFRLEHSSVNRADKGDGYLAAHANYAANENKCEKVIHINMAENRHAIRDYIQRHEEAITRKNARLGDKILLSLPTELSELHREQAVTKFLWLITGQGQSRAVAFYHSDKAHNPHMHVILLDRSVKTGEPVVMMGASRTNRAKAGLEPNATEWLRKAWEKECNAVISEHGYDIVMDRRTNLERGLPEPQEHLGYDNDNHNEEVLELVEDPTQLAQEPEVATVQAPEDEAVATIEVKRTEEVSYAASEIRLLSTVLAEQRYLRNAQARVKEAHDAYTRLVRNREQVATESRVYGAQTEETLKKAYAAKERLEQLQTPEGRLKGFGFSTPEIKVLGLRIPAVKLATLTRKQAEVALTEHERIKPTAEYITRKRVEFSERIEGLSAQATEAEREAFMRQRDLERMYGNAEEMKDAEASFTQTINRTSLGIPLEHAREAFLAVEITPDEYEAYLEQSGHSVELANFREERDRYQLVEVPDIEQEL